MNSKERKKKNPKSQIANRKPRQNTDTDKYRKWFWLALGIILIITFIIYAQAIGFELLKRWDDPLYVGENSHIKDLRWENIRLIFTNFYANNYQPVTMLLYAVENKIGSGTAWIFHLNNILLHLVNTVLVFVLIKKISPVNTMVALITAAFFAVHPMHVESVAWVAERKDVLYTFFFLLSLIIYTKYLKYQNLKFLAYSFILFVLSCMSKPAAVILPLVMFLLDYYTNRHWSWRTIIEKIPFLAASLIFGLITIQSQKGAIQEIAPTMTLLEHVSVVSFSFMSYLFKAFIPVHLSPIYPYPNELGSTLPFLYYISIILIVLLFVFVWYSRRWGKDIIFGFLFFLVTMILVLQFVPVGYAIMADRYSYVPYVGIFFIVGKIYELLSLKVSGKINYQKFSMGAFVIIFGVFALVTFNRVKIWANDYLLFSDVIEKYPKCSKAYINRGEYNSTYFAKTLYARDYVKRESYLKQAVSDFENSAKYALTQQEKSQAYYNLAIAKTDLGDFFGALKDFESSIKTDPEFRSAYLNRGNCYRDHIANNYFSGDTAKRMIYLNMAVSDYKNALKFSSSPLEKAQSYYNLGSVRIDLDDYEGAIRAFDSSLVADAGYGKSFINRGVCYVDYYANRVYAQNKNMREIYLKKALADYETALKCDMSNEDIANACINHGSASTELGDHEASIKDFDKALSINDRNPVAYFKRGNSKYYLNNYQGALDDWNKAIELNPQYNEAIINRNIIVTMMQNSGKQNQ
ncbi:MAG TPA: tetratricopeptide repeat protein [Bacteroidales bacterium]|nr:tetratricopeptide repeat protein [Bacteroidales bacterium]